MKTITIKPEELIDLDMALIIAMKELDKHERDKKIADRLEKLQEKIRKQTNT